MSETQLTPVGTDKDREGPTLDKIVLQPLRTLFWPPASHAIAKVDTFAQIDLAAISEHTGKQIRAVILDVDDCIAEHHGEILPENLAVIQRWVRDGVKVIVFSNMKKTNRYGALEDLGIEVHTGNFAKPNPKGFKECLAKLGTTADETVMIGDNFLTDGGSRRAGIDFIKVAPITGSERKPSIKRRTQVGFRKSFDRVSNFYDMITNRAVWRPEKN